MRLFFCVLSMFAFIQPVRADEDEIDRPLQTKVLTDKDLENINIQLQEAPPTDPSSSYAAQKATVRPMSIRYAHTDLSGSMSRVRDQLYRGSCTAFAVTSLFEFNTSVDYSEQCLVAYGSEFDPGNNEERLQWIRDGKGKYKNGIGGLFTEEECPYNPTDVDSRSTHFAYPPLNSGGSVTTFPDATWNISTTKASDAIAHIEEILSADTPVAVEVFCLKNWDDQHRDQMSPADLNPNVASEWKNNTQPLGTDIAGHMARLRWCAAERACEGHAVVIVGHDSQKQLFKFRNSWGAQYGQGGYGMMTYEFYQRMGQASQVYVRPKSRVMQPAEKVRGMPSYLVNFGVDLLLSFL